MNYTEWGSIAIAVAVTAYVVFMKNPHEVDSDKYISLRICRTGLAFLVWVFASYIFGYAFALVAFILGIVGIVKGRTAYGTSLIIGTIVVLFFATLRLLPIEYELYFSEDFLKWFGFLLKH